MRALKKFFLYTGLILIIALLLLAAIAQIFEDKIGKRVLIEAQKSIKTELNVKSFDLSVISTFPNVAATLEGVRVMGTDGNTLLEAEDVSFRLGLFSLFGSNVKVKKVVISDGALNVQVDKNGVANYDIMVEAATEEEDGTASDEGSEGVGINLQEAVLKDIELLYQDEQSKYYLNTLINNATMSGQFGASTFELDSQADLDVGFFEMEGDRYLVGQKLSYDAKVAIDTEADLYEMEKVEVQLGNLVLALDGSIKMTEEATDYDLVFSSKDGNLKDVVAFLPRSYRAYLDGLETRGQFKMDGIIKGLATAKKQPEIIANMNFSKGRLSGERMSGTVKDVSFEAAFTNGSSRNARSSVFEIKNLRGYFARELFEMSLQVANLDDPQIDFSADGAVPMGILAGLMDNERITKGSGEIEIANLRLQGKYSDMQRTSRMSRVKVGGKIDFDDASITYNGQKMTLDRGSLRLEGNQAQVQDLRLEAPGTDLSFNATASNIIPVFFADSVNSKRAELEFTADLVADELDIDELLALTIVPEEEVVEVTQRGMMDSLETAQVQETEFITRFLKGTFRAKIKDFNYEKIEGRDFDGTISFKNNEMDINGKTSAMGGRFLLDGEMFFEKEPRLIARLTCDDINVHTFFEQSENFGQEVLQARHLEGEMDARIAIYGYWDKKGNFQTDKLRVLAGLGIRDGELKDFEMLESFSSFVKIKDLEEIRFSNLQNFFEIRNRRIIIPAMFVQSNALNLTVSGEHTFDQDIEYYIKVNAGQVLANKFKKHDSSLKPKPARRRGFFNLHYAILGNINDYNYKTDKKRVKEDFRISEQRKQDIRMALEREFGMVIQLIQEPVDWRDIPEYGDPTVDDSDPVFLEFDLEGGNGG